MFGKEETFSEVEVLEGDLTVIRQKKNSYRLREPGQKFVLLNFSQAYELERKNRDVGIQDCVYQIHEKIFKDLSCMKGKTIKKFPCDRSDQIFELRQYESGENFLYHFEEIPTFDSDDRVWDSAKKTALYLDSAGINLITCHHGYRLPRIQIFLGLQEAEEIFFKWLPYLNCPNEKFPKKL